MFLETGLCFWKLACVFGIWFAFSESDLCFRILVCVFGNWFVFDPFGPPYTSKSCKHYMSLTQNNHSNSTFTYHNTGNSGCAPDTIKECRKWNQEFWNRVYKQPTAGLIDVSLTLAPGSFWCISSSMTSTSTLTTTLSVLGIIHPERPVTPFRGLNKLDRRAVHVSLNIWQINILHFLW